MISQRLINYLHLKGVARQLHNLDGSYFTTCGETS